MRNFIVKVLLFLLACVNAVDLMKVKKGKKKAPEIDIAGLGGLLGGLGGIAGGIVGGELGKTISKAG